MNLLPASDQHEPGKPAVPGDRPSAAAAVTALYAEHAVTLTRMARVMLGDLAAAEDVVQEAFFGLYRRWEFLSDPAKAPQYLRSSVLNGGRTMMLASARHAAGAGAAGSDPRVAQFRAVRAEGAVSRAHLFADAADVPLLTAEDRRAILGALRRLPARQREALLLRYYLDLTDVEIAATMGVRQVTVRSAVHRGLARLERILTGEMS